MKVATVILFAVLVAGAAAAVHPVHDIRPISAHLDKNLIDDALELYECIMKAVAVVQDSIGNVMATINGIGNTIDGFKDKFDDCLAIGGENPSIIDQIQQVQCIRKLADEIMATIPATIAELQNSVAQVVIAGNGILECFKSDE